MSTPNLLLDENISPSLVQSLWSEGIDTVHIRDRGLLGIEDHIVWARAQEQARTVVTINLEDFLRLAIRESKHAGILSIPSGGTRQEQLNYVMTAIGWASTGGGNPSGFANHCVNVSVTGDIECFEATLSSYNQLAED